MSNHIFKRRSPPGSLPQSAVDARPVTVVAPDRSVFKRVKHKLYVKRSGIEGTIVKGSRRRVCTLCVLEDDRRASTKLSASVIEQLRISDGTFPNVVSILITLWIIWQWSSTSLAEHLVQILLRDVAIKV